MFGTCEDGDVGRYWCHVYQKTVIFQGDIYQIAECQMSSMVCAIFKMSITNIKNKLN